MNKEYPSRETQEEKKLQETSAVTQQLPIATEFVVAIENVELVDRDRRQMHREQHSNVVPYEGGGREDVPVPFYAEYYYPYGATSQQSQQKQLLHGAAPPTTKTNSVQSPIAPQRGPHSSWYTKQQQSYVHKESHQQQNHYTTTSHDHTQPPLLRRSSSNPNPYSGTGAISSSHKVAPVHPLKRQKPKDAAWEDAPESAALLPKSTFGYGAVAVSKPPHPTIVDTTPVDFGASNLINSNKRNKFVSPERNSSIPTPKPIHRRSSSDNASTKPTHKRSHSEGLPPIHSGRPFAEKSRNQVRGDRSFYSSASPTHLQRQHSNHHRRSSSLSVATDASYMSFVSDIRKSTFFTGFNTQGDAELHYPFENIRLSMDSDLRNGVLYQVVTDPEVYEAYHLAAAAADDDDDDYYHFDEFDRKAAQPFHLPAAQYVMSIPCDLYRRVMDEMADSRIFPCGLFFCGHHEDVRQPSIFIAASCVVLVLCGMGVVAATFC